MSSVFPINDDPRYRRYTASAGQKVFPVPFPFLQDEDLKICLQTSPGEYTVFDPADYSLSGANNPAGGTVTLDTGRSAGDIILVLGEAILDRMSSIVRDGKFSSWLIDSELDRIRIIEQEFRRDNSRSVKADYGSGGLTLDAGIEDGDTLMKEGDRLVPGPNLPELAAEMIAEATAEANRSRSEADRSRDEANRAQNARDQAAAIVNDIASEKEVPIVGVVEALPSLVLPAGMAAIRTNGFDAMGDNGAWPLAVEIPNTGDLEPWHRLTNGGTRRWELRADAVSAKVFNVKGDGVTDDAEAIRNALRWWKFTGYPLRFPAGSYRIASPVLVDLSGVSSVGDIIMEGSIKPDPGIGAAITFRNARGGKFRLRVFGGGQTANYSQADPVGCDEAFRFEGGKGWEATIIGKNYAGRVCRATKSNDPNEFQGQLVKLSVHVDSSAEKTDAEAVRLAAGVGQALFIDTGSVAFGEILSTICFWEKYGSVVENTTDVTHHFIETLYRGLTGFELRGVISYWGGSLNLGSELAAPPDLLTIKSSSTGPSHNIHLKEVFAAAGKIGVNVLQVGTDTLQGIHIGVLHSRLNKQQGLVLNACRGFNITHHSLSDNMGGRVIGGSSYGTLRPHYTRSLIEGLEVGSSVFECKFRDGHILDANQSNAANTPLIRAEGNTNRNYFNDLALSSDRINTVFLLTSGSKHRVRDGSAYNLNNGQLFNELPELFTDVAGWVDKANGSVVIPAGQTSIVVTHGMSAAPNRVFLQEYEPAGGIAKINGAPTATQFTITIPAAIGSDLRIDWRAQMRYSA